MHIATLRLALYMEIAVSMVIHHTYAIDVHLMQTALARNVKLLSQLCNTAMGAA